MAKAQGISRMAVQRIWKQHNLKPHLVKTFKISRDKHFVEKLYDVVGLYLNPPDRSLVLCVDEKSQIQALDRTQPGLPMKKGRCGTMTHDYRRNGTTTLFAALSMLDGKVIGDCIRAIGIRSSSGSSGRSTARPRRLDLHVIVDNYATHKHPRVKSWLYRHPRFHLHFIPTSSSWLNLVERWFRDITDKRNRRGSFGSVPELIAAIEFAVAIEEAKAARPGGRAGRPPPGGEEEETPPGPAGAGAAAAAAAAAGRPRRRRRPAAGRRVLRVSSSSPAIQPLLVRPSLSPSRPLLAFSGGPPRPAAPGRVEVLSRVVLLAEMGKSVAQWSTGDLTSPSNGWSSSRIRKIAPETDSAQTNRAAITVALGGAKRPKLTKIKMSQKTSTTRNGVGIALSLCSTSNQRVCARSARSDAWAWSERCESFCGESSRILS